MGLIVDAESLKRLMHANFRLGSSPTSVLGQIEHFGWPHTQPHPVLVSLHSSLPCRQDCIQGTIVEAWARCKSANIVKLTFPFVSRYGLVWKEYQFEDRC
jgi:hypothetical protein